MATAGLIAGHDQSCLLDRPAIHKPPKALLSGSSSSLMRHEDRSSHPRSRARCGLWLQPKREFISVLNLVAIRERPQSSTTQQCFDSGHRFRYARRASSSTHRPARLLGTPRRWPARHSLSDGGGVRPRWINASLTVLKTTTAGEGPTVTRSHPWPNRGKI